MNPDIGALTLVQLTRNGRFEFRSPGALAGWIVADLDALATQAGINYPTRAQTAYYYMNSSDEARETMRAHEVDVTWISEDHEIYNTHVVGNEAPGGDPYNLYYIGMRMPRADGSPVPAGGAAPTCGSTLAGSAAPTGGPMPTSGAALASGPTPAGGVRRSARSRKTAAQPQGKSKARIVSPTGSEAEGTSTSSSSPVSDRSSRRKTTTTPSKPARRHWKHNMSNAEWYEIGHHGGDEAPKWKGKDRRVYEDWQEIAKWKQQRERRDKKRAAGQKTSAPDVPRTTKEKADEDDFFKRWHNHFGGLYDSKDLQREYSVAFPDSKRQTLGVIEKQKRVTAKLSGKTDRARTQIQPKAKDRSAYNVMLQKWIAGRHAAAGQFKPAKIRLVDARLERRAVIGEAAYKRAAKSAATPERRREVEQQRSLAADQRAARARQRNASGEYDSGDDAAPDGDGKGKKKGPDDKEEKK